MRRRLERLWYHGDGAGAALLQPLGWLYALAAAARRGAYARGWARPQRVGAPVVVVGNLTVGGTGKTPLVIWLAAQLGAAQLTVGIVSRGYGRRGTGLRTVQADSDWREVGDEPVILARRTGCVTVVAADRVRAARTLVARGVDVIVADDGLQHLPLARDCQIVVVDGARGFGNGRLLPAGPLREPLARLAAADLVVLNGPPEHASLAAAGLPAGVLSMRLTPDEARRVDGRAAPCALGAFRGRRVHAVAGIGNPQRFFTELRAQGVEVIEHAFPDHHPLSAAELRFGDDLPVLMTEKDAVKCAPFADPRLWYVPVGARFSEPDARALRARVLEKVLGR
jgi:tetraacyldisaccharide 4'-kinase